MPSLQILDMETRSWTKGPELDALHVISRQSAREFGNGHTREWSACGWRGRLYVVGCEPGYAHDEEEWGMHEGDDWYNETTEVYCFDPATNSWSTLPPLRFAMREGAGLCVHNGRLVVFGQGRPVEALRKEGIERLPLACAGMPCTYAMRMRGCTCVYMHGVACSSGWAARRSRS